VVEFRKREKWADFPRAAVPQTSPTVGTVTGFQSNDERAGRQRIEKTWNPMPGSESLWRGGGNTLRQENQLRGNDRKIDVKPEQEVKRGDLYNP